jgi:hypothetical protein
MYLRFFLYLSLYSLYWPFLIFPEVLVAVLILSACKNVSSKQNEKANEPSTVSVSNPSLTFASFPLLFFTVWGKSLRSLSLCIFPVFLLKPQQFKFYFMQNCFPLRSPINFLLVFKCYDNLSL